MPLQTTHILYRVLLSALILLSLLWLALADWPWADAGEPTSMRIWSPVSENASPYKKAPDRDLIFFHPTV